MRLIPPLSFPKAELAYLLKGTNHENDDNSSEISNVDIPFAGCDTNELDDSSPQTTAIILDGEVNKSTLDEAGKNAMRLALFQQSQNNTLELTQLYFSILKDELASKIKKNLREISTRVNASVTTVNDFIAIRYKYIADYPQKGGNHNGWIDLGLIFVSVFLIIATIEALLLLFPLNAIRLGIYANKIFIFVAMPIYALVAAAWAASVCNTVNPEAEFSWSANLVSILVAAGIGLSIYYSFALGMLTREPIFPVPFSTLLVGIPSTLLVVPFLFCSVSKEKRNLRKMCHTIYLLLAYWFSRIAAYSWSIAIHRTDGQFWQQVVLSAYYISLKWLCKIPLVGNITTRLNEERAIQLNHVVDIEFVTIQCITTLYIDSFVIALLYWCSDLFLIVWRIYIAPERFQLLVKSQLYSRIYGEFTQFISIKKCLSSSPNEIHKMSLQVNSNNTDKTALSSFDANSSASSFDGGQNNHDSERKYQIVGDNIKGQEVRDVLANMDDDEDSVGLNKEDIQGIFRHTEQCAELDSDIENDKEETHHENEEDYCHYLYHVVDSAAMLIIHIMVRFYVSVVLVIIQFSPNKSNLIDPINVSPERLKNVIQWSLFYFAAIFLSIVIACFVLKKYFANINLHGLSVSSALSYSFKKYFWYYLFCLSMSAMTVSSCMIPHFGIDFTMTFKDN